MRERPVTNAVPTPAAFINAQSAITGLRGRDLLSTLRSVATHGLRNPLHRLDTPWPWVGNWAACCWVRPCMPDQPQDGRFADPTWTLNPLYRRSLQAYLSWQKQSATGSTTAR